MAVKFTEKAVLTINGRDFSEWESVMVRCAMHEAPPAHCRFTCSEGVPISENFAKMQIMPGMICTVTLAGQLAFTGKVETRQVYYDANRHHIEIQCASMVDVIKHSVISQTGEHKLKTFKQIAEPKLNALGYKLVFRGTPPTYKFPRISETHGESLFDFLDVLARGLGLHFTTDPQENFVAVVSSAGPTGSDTVTEGVDILIGREILNRPSASSYYPAMSQSSGTDQKHGPQVSHMPFHSEAIKSFMGATFATAPGVIRNELATSDKSLLQERANMEGVIEAGDKVTVFATVYGWLRPSGGLWQQDQDVVVNSPMLVMKNETLRTKAVTFTQDNSTGTRTTLEMRNPAAMTDKQMPGAVS